MLKSAANNGANEGQIRAVFPKIKALYRGEIPCEKVHQWQCFTIGFVRLSRESFGGVDD